MTDKCNNVPLLFGISTSHGVKYTMVGNALLKTGSLEKEKKSVCPIDQRINVECMTNH